jgi:acyl-coenzyme A synthetase/AMP-(fatty) acid ligase/3-hydroxymyristoyl/3-hydroxydecanoyl-(acyl carrier protein) dehydratase
MINLSEINATNLDHPVAFHNDSYFSFKQFKQQVNFWTGVFLKQSSKRIALYSYDAYPFTVLLFALLQAGKQIWIPGNNLPATARALENSGCQLIGDWLEAFDYQLTKQQDNEFPLVDLEKDAIVLFTSGSNGLPKQVTKSIQQLQNEINCLEKQWGHAIENCQIYASVSHQHIYGLLFRVLWPLASGRCFNSQNNLYKDNFQHNHQSICWVSCPAHLKRLDFYTAWINLSQVRMIFSSGGVLPFSVSEEVSEKYNILPIEIYGSTETGGIAWRQHPFQSWTLFENLKLDRDGENIFLYSPYLPDRNSYLMDDQLQFDADNKFQILGRKDTVVKIEEKRLSLTALELLLTDSIWLDQAVVVKLTTNREYIGVIAVLSEKGKQYQNDFGRKALVDILKLKCLEGFETLFLPRKWIFINSLPVNDQGKIDKSLLYSLFDVDAKKYPLVKQLSIYNKSVSLDIKVSKKLIYFADHFRDFPILPGVIQVGWVEYFSKLLLPIHANFSHMEVIKFIKPILPGVELNLQLDWQADKGKLTFSYKMNDEIVSSGRILYR